MKRLKENAQRMKEQRWIIDKIIATSGPDDAVCVAGSLYVVGEAKAMLEKAKDDLFQV